MIYIKLLSDIGTFLLLFVGLVLVNNSVLSDYVLRSTWRRDLMLYFCLGGDSQCEDLLSEIILLDKIFKVLTEEPTLRNLVSFVLMEGAVDLRSGTSMVMWFFFWMLNSGLTFDGFEDVLNRELQQGEVVVYSVGLEWALLRVRERFLLERALSASLGVDRGVSMLRFSFVSSSPRLKDGLVEFFIASSNWTYGWPRWYKTSLQWVTLYFTRF